MLLQFELRAVLHDFRLGGGWVLRGGGGWGARMGCLGGGGAWVIIWDTREY